MSNSRTLKQRIHTIPWPLRWLLYLLVLLFLLAALYGVGRLVHVALGSYYTGDRGPYLQMPAPDAMTLRWQTREPEKNVVHYGVRPDYLPWRKEESSASEEHEVRLDYLQPDTRYYYQISEGTNVHYGGADYWFVTPPLVGAPVPVRFAVLGDPGYFNPVQSNVRYNLVAWLVKSRRPGRPYLDLWLTTGDNAYTSGTNKQFQEGFFRPYASLLKNIPVWPAYGNHDARRWAFFNVFSFPTEGESGGVPSGTEHYYSFDYGPVHFVMLDTESGNLNEAGPMLSWLKEDLAANKLTWTIAVFHHPPYTQGTHDSDQRSDSRGRMFAVRENILPLLEQAGVDLVLSGHSHMYQRSGLLACHFGTSDTLQPTMWRGAEMGRDEKVVYQKSARGAHNGTIYAVVGSSSKVDDGPLDHPAMVTNLHAAGALVINIQGQRLNGVFVQDDGSVGDEFALIKLPGERAYSCE